MHWPVLGPLHRVHSSLTRENTHLFYTCSPVWQPLDEEGNVVHSYQVIHRSGPMLMPPSIRIFKFKGSGVSLPIFVELTALSEGKGTIWLALVYCTPCQFELINHIYPSILITPCLATRLALSCWPTPSPLSLFFNSFLSLIIGAAWVEEFCGLDFAGTDSALTVDWLKFTAGSSQTS